MIVRTKNPFDNATPSGNSLGALALLRLGAMKGDQALWQQGEQTLVLFEQLLRRAPSAGAQMLCALDFYLARPTEVALVGDQDECRTFAAALHGALCPIRSCWPLALGRVKPRLRCRCWKGNWRLAAGRMYAMTRLAHDR